ncbi:nuclear transport factor 2 family protein [Algoriphagus chordae]|uniref:SnoaL-like protein n=1 Tax=Algoriphagus chordae TaxID=237019 RepID=A0A2W7QD85_9BACT|nr:nuclear transport factor 2 family protein [Algoriphagus chordae]PZX46498.1 SnoaL-like protein [Algoriphagus chordae]
MKLDRMTKTEIAKAFSNGEFEITYDFIAENAEWIVIEEDKFSGKQAIIDHCEQVESYFKSVTTDFKTHNIIADGNKVVINGMAEFLRDGKRISFVSACDLYEFNDANQIQRITSYCIQSKEQL